MRTPLGVFIMIASLDVLATKAEEVASPHEVGLAFMATTYFLVSEIIVNCKVCCRAVWWELMRQNSPQWRPPQYFNVLKGNYSLVSTPEMLLADNIGENKTFTFQKQQLMRILKNIAKLARKYM